MRFCFDISLQYTGLDGTRRTSTSSHEHGSECPSESPVHHRSSVMNHSLYHSLWGDFIRKTLITGETRANAGSDTDSPEDSSPGGRGEACESTKFSAHEANYCPEYCTTAGNVQSVSTRSNSATPLSGFGELTVAVCAVESFGGNFRGKPF